MRIASQFEIAAPCGRVWEALLDPTVMLASIPGCRDLRALDADHFAALAGSDA